MSECKQCQGRQGIQMMTIEDMIRMQKQQMINANKGYVKSLEKALKTMKELMDKKDKDRLDYAFILVSMVFIMKSSVEGWSKWCNITKLQDIFDNKEEMEKTITEMLKIVTKWIQMDIDVTKKTMKNIEAGMETKPSKKPRKTRKKTHYVA